MHQTITIVTLPKKLLFKIPQNNYILRKRKHLIMVDVVIDITIKFAHQPEVSLILVTLTLKV